MNGSMGTIRMVGPSGVLVDVGPNVLTLAPRSQWISQDGERDMLCTAFDLDYGYAITVHKAQGMTLAAGMVVFENFAPEGWAYILQ